METLKLSHNDFLNMALVPDLKYWSSKREHNNDVLDSNVYNCQPPLWLKPSSYEIKYITKFIDPELEKYEFIA